MAINILKWAMQQYGPGAVRAIFYTTHVMAWRITLTDGTLKYARYNKSAGQFEEVSVGDERKA